MTTWFTLEPVDEEFFDTATYRFVYPMELRANADEVWAAVASPTPLAWVKHLSAEYTTAAPLGVGTKRSVTVRGGLLRLRERFFEWDNNRRRHSFYVEQASAPMFRAFAEDYQVQATATGCRFTWTFAFDPKPKFELAMRAARPVNRLLFDSFIRDTGKHFGVVHRSPG